VLTLQNGINRSYLEMLPLNGQIVIYGREGHAEVNALKGQTNGSAIVIENENDFCKIDFSRPVRLFSQTTKGVDGFNKMVKLIRERMQEVSEGNPVDFDSNDSICRQVSNRSDDIQVFAARFDVIVFVSGQKSSNGMILYQLCKDVAHRTHLVSGISELDIDWFKGAETVGICGATSTPMWLMEEVASEIQKISQ
jgi:4-hydroxy-3-methylbut-2-enyl diphosphate reductase